MLAGCKRNFAVGMLIAAFSCSFFASTAFALGLGDLRVNSTLNQPLDATIQLLGLEGLDETQILATMGNVEDFERAGVARVGLIDDVDFEIIVINAEDGVLILSSDEPVVEPFLNMVISIRWPSGRLMRNYTALIDLPVFVSEEQEVVPVDVPETPAPEREITPEPEQVPEPATQPRVLTTAEPEVPSVTPEPEVVAESEQEIITEAEQVPEPVEEVVEQIAEETTVAEEASVVVESGDTLYNIAAEIRPDTTVSVEQTMLAIQRSNPDAFIDNNINMIRVGQVLRIPSIQEIQSMDQAQALSQVTLQNQAATTQPLAFSSNNSGAAPQGDDELTILSGEEGTDSLSGDSDLAETLAALENQLAISEENLDRARLENTELRARFAELEEQVEILQNIIAMQDERLAQLQADLAARNAEPEVAAEVAAQPQQIVDTPAQPPQQDDSLMGQISSMFENTLVLLSSLFGLILLVVGFLVWRRRAALAEFDDYDIGEAAVATDPEAFIADEPEGASSGFIAALKNRFSGEDDIDEKSAEDEIEVDEYDDDEEGGLLAKIKGIFSRSSDDEEYEDVLDEDEDGSGDFVDEELGEEPEEETDGEDLEELEGLIEDFDQGLDGNEEFEDEAEDSSTDVSGIGEADEEVDDSGEKSVEDEDEIVDLDIDDSDSDEEISTDDALTSEYLDAEEDIVGELLDEDDALTTSDEIAEVDELALDAEPVIAEQDVELDSTPESDEEIVSEGLEFDVTDSTETESEAAAKTEDETTEEVEAFDFSLDEVAPTDEGAEVAEEPEAEKESDVETFDFDLEKSAPAAEADQKKTEEPEDVETFDFNVEDTPAIQPETEAAQSDAEQQEDVETFDFNVEDTPASQPEVEAKPPESAQEEEVETFDFDVSSVSSFEEEASGTPDNLEEIESISPEDIDLGSDADSENPVIEIDEGEALVEIDLGSTDEDEAADPLAAALDEIDAEAGDAAEETESETAEDSFDLGNIDIDDSLFEKDDSEEVVVEPITDRDESSTKLDLAVAYEAMGDIDGAKEILQEVIAEGNDEQVTEAKKLLEKWEQ